MLGAGTVINPIIKIVTTVAILAAVGIFIVRAGPRHDDKAIDSANDSIRDAQAQSRQASDDFDLDFARTRAESFAGSLQSSWPAAARAVKACVKQAGDETQAMQRCEDFGQKLVSTVQSDRNFALSYATSLEAHGQYGRR